MHIVVFEDHRYRDLLPLVYWRAVFELRCGWDSLVAKVRRAYADVPVHARMRSSIREVVCEREPTFDGAPPRGQRVLFLNGRLLVTRPVPVDVWPCVGRTADAIVYVAADARLAERLRDVCWTDEAAVAQGLAGVPDVSVPLPAGGMVRYPWDLVYANGPELLRQWDADGAAGVAGRVDAGVYLLNEAGIHIGENSRIQSCTVIDAEKGPVFIGDGVTVYMTRDGDGVGWCTGIADATMFPETDTEDMLRLAAGDVADNVVVDAYPIEITGKNKPMGMREKIRAGGGPTIAVGDGGAPPEDPDYTI